MFFLWQKSEVIKGVNRNTGSPLKPMLEPALSFLCTLSWSSKTLVDREIQRCKKPGQAEDWMRSGSTVLSYYPVVYDKPWWLITYNPVLTGLSWVVLLLHAVLRQSCIDTWLHSAGSSLGVNHLRWSLIWTEVLITWFSVQQLNMNFFIVRQLTSWRKCSKVTSSRT